MNCRRFQNDLYEYLDGELAPRLRAAVEKHLAECADCRAKLAQEQGFGQSLRDSFRRAAELLELPPSVGRRVLAALAEAHRAAQEERGTVFFWRRLAWPLAVAASVFVLLGAWTAPNLRRKNRADLGIALIDI